MRICWPGHLALSVSAAILQAIRSISLKSGWLTVMGGGTGGSHGPRPPHFFSEGAWTPTFLPKYCKFK